MHLTGCDWIERLPEKRATVLTTDGHILQIAYYKKGSGCLAVISILWRLEGPYNNVGGGGEGGVSAQLAQRLVNFDAVFLLSSLRPSEAQNDGHCYCIKISVYQEWQE